MTQKLQALISQCYKLFAKYPLQKMEGCSCPACEEKITFLQRTLANTPLHELNEHALSLYNHKAISTFGEAADFKHFLPRSLELITQNDMPFMGFWHLRSKLLDANWHDWPSEEKELVLLLLLEYTLEYTKIEDDDGDLMKDFEAEILPLRSPNFHPN